MDDTLPLLKQIAENTSGHQLTWVVAVITGGTAILASLVTAVFAYKTTKRTIAHQKDVEYKKLETSIVTEDAKLKANIIAVERLRWLQDLRGKFADLYANLDMQLSHLERPGSPSEQQDQLDKLSADIMLRVNSVLVMLNKTKPHQGDLYVALNDAQAFIFDVFARKHLGASTPVDKPKYAGIKQRAFDSVEAIGARAWQKVKTLE
jgi:hypothetical protein